VILVESEELYKPSDSESVVLEFPVKPLLESSVKPSLAKQAFPGLV